MPTLSVCIKLPIFSICPLISALPDDSAVISLFVKVRKSVHVHIMKIL